MRSFRITRYLNLYKVPITLDRVLVRMFPGVRLEKRLFTPTFGERRTVLVNLATYHQMNGYDSPDSSAPYNHCVETTGKTAKNPILLAIYQVCFYHGMIPRSSSSIFQLVLL
jgi:hypothetical protein